MSPENGSLTPYFEEMSPENNGLSPENGSLTPYFEEMSPENNGLSPEQNSDLSTKLNTSGDNGDTGDIFKKLEEEGDDKINSILGGTANQNVDHMIIYKEPFYYCKHHPKVQNIHKRGDRAPYPMF
jgi:hypothetical protein